MPPTALTALRRQQLADLARAFGISLPAGATKDQMLPMLITAEQQGVFKQPPKEPYYLQKAHLTSDMPKTYLPPAPGIEEAVIQPSPKRQTKQSDYHRKQRLLKEIGVDTWGKTKAEMDELAEEHGIS